MNCNTYQINVAKLTDMGGIRRAYVHIFRTDEIDVRADAEKAFKELAEKFPRPAYKVSMSGWDRGRTEVANNDFPIIIKVKPKHLEEFAACEEGLWDDMGHDEDVRTCDGTLAAFPILTRHADHIELRNRDEAEAVMWAAESGTFNVHYPKVCARVIEELRAYEIDFKFIRAEIQKRKQS